jgi:hypothetical protein
LLSASALFRSSYRPNYWDNNRRWFLKHCRNVHNRAVLLYQQKNCLFSISVSSISPISRFFCCFVTLNTMIFTNRTYFPANSLWVRGIFVSLRQLL